MKTVVSVVGSLVASLVLLVAITVYAAADNVVISSVGAQVGYVEYGTASDATFSIEVTGDANPGEVDWSISGVPGGVSASFSENPSVGTGVWTTTLTLTSNDVIDPGTYVMTITADGDGVGADDTETVTFTIEPREITADGVIADDKVYDNTTNATASGTLVDVINGDDVTYDVEFVDELVGADKDVDITLTGADAAKYIMTEVLLANITKKDVTIVSGDFATNERVYDGTTDAELRVTPDSLVLSGVELGDVVSVGGGTGLLGDRHIGIAKTVTFSDFETTGTDGANYNLVTQPDPETQDITPRPITVRPTDDTKVYDGATSSAATPTVTGGTLAAGDTGLFTQFYATPEVGSGKTMISVGTVSDGNGGSNYDVTHQPRTNSSVTPFALTLSGVNVNDKIYDGNTSATLAAGGTLIGIIGADDVAPDLSSAVAVFGNENASTGKAVTVTGAALTGTNAFNYSVVQPTTTGTILPRPISITAVTDTKPYDGATTSVGVPFLSAGTLVLGDSAVYSQTFATKHVGTGKTLNPAAAITDGNGGNNYAVTAITNNTGVVTAIPLVVTATGVNKTYDGNATATVTFGDNRVAGDVLTATGTASFDDKFVGGAKAIAVTGISLSGADAMNYVPNATTSTTGEITARTLTVTIVGNDKVYDGTTEATITTGDDRVMGDVLTVDYPVSGPDRPLFDNRHAGAGKTVSVSSLSISGADASNYTIGSTTAVDVDVEITPAPITVSFMADDKVYDATTTAAISSSTIVSALLHIDDEVTLTAGSAHFANKAVGTGKTVVGTGFTLGGAEEDNYVIGLIATTTATITPKTLVVNVNANNKVYDGSDVATVTYSDDRITGDDVVATGTANFSDKHVATGKIVTVSSIGLLGGDALNYAANTTATTTADITARNLLVTITAADKEFDRTSVATVTYSDNRVAGDEVVATGTATFVDANPGVAKLVTANGIVLSGIDGGNYLANTIATGTATIREVSGSTGSRRSKSASFSTPTPAPTVGTTTVSTTTFKFMVDLQIGSSHPDVKELQKVLIAGGYLKIAAPTGFFGPLTFEALKAYQAAHPEIGFVTGYFGPLTRAVMNK